MITYHSGYINEMVDENDLPRINELLSDLYSNIKPADQKTLRDFLEYPNTHIVIARDDESKGEKGLSAAKGQIVGMGLITILRKWGYRYGFVEDIVVHENYRGRTHGIADTILSKLDETAKANSAVQSDLTCGPTRVAAHKVYERNGYKKRETVPYRKVHGS